MGYDPSLSQLVSSIFYVIVCSNFNHKSTFTSIIECCTSWSEFSPFSSCSVSCGGGVMTSYRTCQCGEVGDVGCEGNETRQAPCATEECIGTWGEFGGYGSCSVSCGGGTQSRTR